MANTLEYLSNARTLQTRDPLRTFELASAVKGKAKDDGEGRSRAISPRNSD